MARTYPKLFRNPYGVGLPMSIFSAISIGQVAVWAGHSAGRNVQWRA